MHVTVSTPSEKLEEKMDYRCFCNIKADGVSLSFMDGEPEDANLSRDFNDIFSIPDVMKKAFEAGKNGEEFTVEEIEVDEL